MAKKKSKKRERPTLTKLNELRATRDKQHAEIVSLKEKLSTVEQYETEGVPVRVAAAEAHIEARGLLHAVLQFAPNDTLGNKIRKFLGVPITTEVVSRSLRYIRESRDQVTPAPSGN